MLREELERLRSRAGKAHEDSEMANLELENEMEQNDEMMNFGETGNNRRNGGLSEGRREQHGHHQRDIASDAGPRGTR